MTHWLIGSEKHNPAFKPREDAEAKRTHFPPTGEIYNDAAGPVEDYLETLDAETGVHHSATRLGA